MRRRDFIAGLGGTAVVPIVGSAQQPRRRRVAVLMLYAETDPEGQIRAEAFRQGLEKAGWETGRNIAVDYLWGGFDADLARTVTTQLRRQAPDVMVANGGQGLRAIAPAVGNVPVVFIGINEPVALGFVTSHAHPGGRMTGFTNLEPTMGSKWLELLKVIAPRATRAVFIYHPESLGNRLLIENAITASKKLSIEATESPVREPVKIDAAVATLGRGQGGAIVVPPDPFTTTHRRWIIELAGRDRLPVISALRSFADEGGLLAYGAYIPELFRQAAGYVDRILRGDSPADLPVQQPTKFELVINLKTAKALGLTVPETLLATADEVIQ
jgi:putative tryptophan/tyrosine transport system substrate-binding protein